MHRSLNVKKLKLYTVDMSDEESVRLLHQEFDSIWSLIRSWNSLCCPLVRASQLWRNFVCVDVYTIVADLVHHGEPAVLSTLYKGIQVQFFKHVGHTSWGLSRIVDENKTGRSALNLLNSVDVV